MEDNALFTNRMSVSDGKDQISTVVIGPRSRVKLCNWKPAIQICTPDGFFGNLKVDIFRWGELKENGVGESVKSNVKVLLEFIHNRYRDMHLHTLEVPIL